MKKAQKTEIQMEAALRAFELNKNLCFINFFPLTTISATLPKLSIGLNLFSHCCCYVKVDVGEKEVKLSKFSVDFMKSKQKQTKKKYENENEPGSKKYKKFSEIKM